MKFYSFLTLLLLLFHQNVLAKDIYATTDDGVRVLLRDDASWVLTDKPENINEEIEEDITKVDLKVTGKWEMRRSCRIGLTLTNRKAKYIRNLGLEFTAYTKDDVGFDTIIIGFHGIKPTQYQYQDAIFEGISCENISHILVHGGNRCSVGEDLVKFSTIDGECLSRINVIPSKLINIHK